MKLTEALEAALSDGMAYASNDARCDVSIENLHWLLDMGPEPDGDFIYRDGSIYRISPVDGIEDEVYFCQTADEVHAERKAAAK